MRSSPRFFALALATFLASGCGDDGVQVITEVQFDASLDIDLSMMTRTSSGLYIEVVTEGTGDAVSAGVRVTVNYTGWLINGTSFDSGQFPFTVGAGQVVPGFDEGVDGMKVGEVRRIVIPPALGYGNQQVGSIPAGSIMIFRIELVSVG